MENVPFAVFIETPLGMQAIECVLDIPSSGRGNQRACIELYPSKERVDLLSWFESNLPPA